MLVTSNIPVASYNQFHGIAEREIKFYKPFGDMAIVEDNHHRKTRSKLANHGFVCSWVMHPIMQQIHSGS
jgi:hypothetical protein